MKYIKNMTDGIDHKVDAERYVRSMMEYIEHRPDCGGKRALLYYCNYVLQYNEIPNVREIERELGVGTGVLYQYLKSVRIKLLVAICRAHSVTFLEIYNFVKDY